MIGCCYNDSYIYHGEFLFMQECHNFINVCNIDWWVDFICASPSGSKFVCPAVKNGSSGHRAMFWERVDSTTL